MLISLNELLRQGELCARRETLPSPRSIAYDNVLYHIHAGGVMAENEAEGAHAEKSKNQTQAAPESLWTAVVPIVPSLLWFLLAAFVVWQTYGVVLELVRAGALRKIGIGTVQLEFAAFQLTKVRDLENQGLTEAEQKHLLWRFSQLGEALSTTSILWVDDGHPAQNASLRPLLQSLGVVVDLATSTEDAFKWLAAAKYDIVITDLRRDNDRADFCFPDSDVWSAGCALLKLIGPGRRNGWPRLLIYAGEVNYSLPTPAYADGITNQPYRLLNLILDAVAAEPLRP